jgi:hypothetical protein
MWGSARSTCEERTTKLLDGESYVCLGDFKEGHCPCCKVRSIMAFDPSELRLSQLQLGRAIKVGLLLLS